MCLLLCTCFPLCYLCANQSTLDCMQVLLGQIIYLSVTKPSLTPVDRTTKPHLL